MSVKVTDKESFNALSSDISISCDNDTAKDASRLPWQRLEDEVSGARLLPEFVSLESYITVSIY